MTTTRRNVFKFMGGSAAGALLTPAPWRLITDSALWSENWPGIPRPARGEIRTRFTNCSLCAAGCPVRARCVGAQPVSLAGVGAGLCPAGVAGHHFPYHPSRLKEGPVKEAAAAAAAAISRLGPNELVAVLDLRPGRTVSWTYRRALSMLRNGVYLAPPQPPVAVDLARVKTVLSLGVPLLESWGTPASVLAARARFRLIQAEPVQSRTAILADTWIPTEPGRELALASSMLAGLREDGPALILDPAMSPAVLELNHELGAPVFLRPEAPIPAAWRKAAPVADLSAIPDRSVRVLLIDEAGGYFAWPAIEKKLVRDNPLVIAFAWSREGYGRHVKYVLPTAVYPETMDDLPGAIDSVTAAFRLSVPLLAPPPGVVDPAAFLAHLVGFDPGDPLRERANAIHQLGRGAIQSKPVKEMTADAFWSSLTAAAPWLDAADRAPRLPNAPTTPPLEPSLQPAGLPLTVVLTPAPRSSPLLSKIYAESNLRLAPRQAALHPSSAAGLADRSRAMLQTLDASVEIQLVLDPAIPPGMVQVGWSPAILDACATSARAKVVPL